MSDDRHRCPRRNEGFGSTEPGDLDGWRLERGYRSCSFCGSLHPDEFMAALEAGVEIGPTDKSYKAYLDVLETEPRGLRRVASRTCRPDEPRPVPEFGREWMTWEEAVERHPELREEHERHLAHVASLAPSHPWHIDVHRIQVEERGQARHEKFYYQHLSDAQRDRFVELHNAGGINIGYPHRFYVTPFFARGVTPA